MKCPFCGQEMSELEIEESLNPVIVYGSKDKKQVAYQDIDRYLICSTCGFVAPFFDPSDLKKVEN